MQNDVRLLRFLAQDMTQAELGRRVGLTRQTIAAIEQGRYSPSLDVAFRIADVFNKRIDEVFHWRRSGPRTRRTRRPPRSAQVDDACSAGVDASMTPLT
jgi:putative transcriptional regulator